MALRGLRSINAAEFVLGFERLDTGNKEAREFLRKAAREFEPRDAFLQRLSLFSRGRSKLKARIAHLLGDLDRETFLAAGRTPEDVALVTHGFRELVDHADYSTEDVVKRQVLELLEADPVLAMMVFPDLYVSCVRAMKPLFIEALKVFMEHRESTLATTTAYLTLCQLPAIVNSLDDHHADVSLDEYDVDDRLEEDVGQHEAYRILRRFLALWVCTQTKAMWQELANPERSENLPQANVSLVAYLYVAFALPDPASRRVIFNPLADNRARLTPEIIRACEVRVAGRALLKILLDDAAGGLRISTWEHVTEFIGNGSAAERAMIEDNTRKRLAAIHYLPAPYRDVVAPRAYYALVDAVLHAVLTGAVQYKKYFQEVTDADELDVMPTAEQLASVEEAEVPADIEAIRVAAAAARGQPYVAMLAGGIARNMLRRGQADPKTVAILAAADAKFPEHLQATDLMEGWYDVSHPYGTWAWAAEDQEDAEEAKQRAWYVKLFARALYHTTGGDPEPSLRVLRIHTLHDAATAFSAELDSRTALRRLWVLLSISSR
jgi:hypothetical protein